MTMQSIIQGTATFMDYLGLGEEPFGVYYTDTKPENAYGPKVGTPISRELEDKGELDMQEVMKTFNCVMGSVWLARKKHGAAFNSNEEYGCVGGAYYCSMMKPPSQIHRVLRIHRIRRRAPAGRTVYAGA